MLSFANRVGLALTLVASAVSLSTRALAAAPSEVEPTVVVFELQYASHPFDKTAEYARLVEAAVLQSGGLAVLERADAEKRVRAKIPQAAAVSTAAQADDVRKAVKEAEDIFFAGDTKTALDRLKDANAKLRKILDGLSLAESIRAEYISTQMLLMLIYHRSKQEDKAREVASELVKRVGEDPTISEDNYHPEAVAIYRDMGKALAAKRIGKIAVSSSPAGADIYINGTRQEKKTPATIEGLFPGQVLVQVRKDGRASLVKEVIVGDGAAIQLDVDLEFESALAFDGSHFGLVFRDEADRERRLPAFAAKLGGIVNADRVAFVGIGERGGKTYLEAYLLRAPSAELVRGTELASRADVISKNRADQLAAFLVYGDAPETAYKPWYTNTAGWVLTGIGVVGVGVGAAMYVAYTDDRAIAECNPSSGTCEPEPRRRAAKSSADTERGVAYAGFGIGAAAIVGGVLAFVLMHDEDADAPTKKHVPGASGGGTTGVVPAPFWVPGGAGIGASVSF